MSEHRWNENEMETGKMEAEQEQAVVETPGSMKQMEERYVETNTERDTQSQPQVFGNENNQTVQTTGNLNGKPNQQPYGNPGDHQSQQSYGNPNGQQNQNPYGQPMQGNPYHQNYNRQQGPYPYGRNPQMNGGNNGQQPNRPTYQGPYPYGYQQHQNMNRNPGNDPRYQAPKKKGSLLKKTALVTAAALLFGTISGVTMFGVNYGAQLLFPAKTQTQQQVPVETQAALEQTQTVPTTPQISADHVTGVVIEDVSPIVEAAMPSVVAITNTMLYKSNTWFGQTQTYEVPSSGSGIIVGENDTELLVVTNNHVIEDSTSISVTFIDESTVEAAVKGTDSASDLAVLAVPLDQISADTKAQIKAATMGDSDSLKMGQGVIAIGNALGHGQSVTVGHVSALNREITVDGTKKTVIQTDAAINPGNSGGALLNSKGEVIGINEAKYASQEVEGVGYAIPISYAMEIIEDLKLRTTKVEVEEKEQGYLGIQVQNIDSRVAELYGMPQGAYVYKITENSAAADSDLREKDIITKFDGETVRSGADLTELLTYYKAGTTVTVTVQSLENGSYVERQVEITLKNRPQEDTQEDTQAAGPGMRP